MFEYRLITKADNDIVIEHLTKCFLTEEPLSIWWGTRAFPLKVQQRIFKSIDHSVSVMAVDDNGKLAGLLLNKINYADDSENSTQLWETAPDEKTKNKYGLLKRLNNGVNLFEKFRVDKVFYNYILSVSADHQRQGLGKELYRRSEEIARNMHFQWITAELTGIHSQKIFKDNGFEVLHELMYADYVDDCGIPILNIPGPHTKIQLVAKTLI